MNDNEYYWVKRIDKEHKMNDKKQRKIKMNVQFQQSFKIIPYKIQDHRLGISSFKNVQKRDLC